MAETERQTADAVTMDKIVSLSRRRGFVFPSSEIYGGLGSAYDYGHYGVLAKNNAGLPSSLSWSNKTLVRGENSILLSFSGWSGS